MTRSLRTRWTLALIAVCVVEAALVAVAVRVSTVRTFEQFVIDEALDGFVADVADVVRETGSLDTVSQGIGAAGPDAAPPPAAAPSPGTGRPPSRPPPPRERDLRPGDAPRPTPPRRSDRLPPPASSARRVQFGLTDPSGRIVLPFDGAARGEAVSPEALAEGHPVEVDGRRVALAFVPADAADRLDTYPATSPEARFLASSTPALWGALAAALAVAVALALWLSERTVRPIRDLTLAARRIADGDLRQSVEATTDDEVGQLATAFNDMSARLDEATDLRRRMTADLSHDLRTPLTAVLGILEAVQTGALPATPPRLATAHAEAQRLGRLIEDLHVLALADAQELPIHLGSVDPPEALRRTAGAFEARAADAGVRLIVRADAAPSASADADRLGQVLGNLVSNALRHTPDGGTIMLDAHAVDGGVALTVADTGEGIPADVLPVVFERSVRADAARSGPGAGLGLSIVRSLAEAMGGTVTAASTPGTGTTMTVTLPQWEATG